MDTQLIAGIRTEPLVSINDPRFVYVTAAKTDISRTFARVRARMAAEAAEAKAVEIAVEQDKVRELRRK